MSRERGLYSTVSGWPIQLPLNLLSAFAVWMFRKVQTYSNGNISEINARNDTIIMVVEFLSYALYYKLSFYN